MYIRFYQPSDAPALKEIFAEQNLPVHLPLPDEDPCVAVAVVGVEGDRIVGAAIGRLTVEAHWIVRPNEPSAFQKLKRLTNYAEGSLLEISKRMRQLGFPMVDDLEAFVPVAMEKMVEAAKLLGFKEESGEFKPFWKKIGM